MSDSRPLILAIDDQPANLLTLKAMLTGEFVLQVAQSGSQGIALAGECRPDLILINLMMSERDGYETCRRLKADPQLQDVPLVFVTALTESVAATARQAPSVVASISVPLNIEITRRRIRNLLHREQLRRAAESYRQQLAVREQALLESEAFTRTILNSLTEHIAVLDPQGAIVAVNRAWQHFAAANGAPALAGSCVGVDYRSVCSAATGQPVAADALRAWNGIAAVMSRTESDFTFEYPRDSPDDRRSWFRMRVYPMLAPCEGVVVVHEDISERKQAEEALRASEERLTLVLRGTQDGFWDWDLVRHRLHYSARWWNMLGYEEGELNADPDLWQRLVHPDDLASVRRIVAAALAEGKDTYEVEFRLRHKDGHYLDINSRAIVLRDPQGKAIRLSGANMDITPRKRAEEALREQKEFFRLIAENLQGFIAVLDVDGRRVYNSPSYARLVGERDLVGTSSFAEVHPADRERVIKAFQETVATGVGHYLEYRFLMADGGTRLLESRGGVIRDNEGRTKRVVVISHDVTERRESEEKIHRLAFYDALTQLPNRLTLNDRLRQAMAASKRSACYGALMFIDLDHFKPLNDAHGHEAGDLLLIEAANRLTTCMRGVDTVARFGGDEFAVVLSDLDADQAESTGQAMIVAEKVRSRLADPYLLTITDEADCSTQVEHHCTASIGVVLFFDHQASPSDLLKWADAAMYQAKEAGRNAIHVHDDDRGGIGQQPDS
jgi:diguanylate cyclase (GGDEF)-like protein/PAS domain S-box-containing protein